MINSFLKNGFYNSAGGIIRIGLALLTIPLLIRLIGVEEYGLWTLISAMVAIVGLAEAGLSTATTVFVSQDLGKEEVDGLSQTLTVTIASMLIFATLAGMALWLGAENIVGLFPKLEQGKRLASVEALQIGSLVIWARLLQQVLTGVEQAYQRYALLNLLNTMQLLLLNVGLFAVAWFGGRIVALMEWQALISVAALLSHILVVRSLLQNLNLQIAWEKQKGLAIARYSLTIWLISLGTALFSRGDRLIVASFLGSETLGIYAAITDATAAINSFSALPVQPLIPILSNQKITHNTNTPELKQALEVNGLVALCSGVWLFVLAPLVMHLMLKDAVTDTSIVAFRVATVIYALFSLNAVGFYILLCRAVNLVAIIQLMSGLFTLILIVIGAKNFGLLGAVIGNIGFLTTWLMIFYGMRQLQLSNWLWLKYLSFPLAWFIICIPISLLSNNIVISVILAVVQTFILLVWFFKSHKNLKYIFK